MSLRISTKREEFDVDMIHRYLTTDSYWGRGLPRTVLDRALEHSLCFGGFLDRDQVAFARVVTDHATHAHLKDVFVLPAFQGRGYGEILLRHILAYPTLQHVAFTLVTVDAQGFYERLGFAAYPQPSWMMSRDGSFLDAHPSK